MDIAPCGECAVSVRFEENISPETHARVMRLCNAVERAQIEGVGECVPSYCALMVLYDPLRISYSALCGRLNSLDVASETSKTAILPVGKTVMLPVCYGGEYGPDIADVAAHAGLGIDETVALHSAVDYPVYMLGFTPGFPYLGGMDKRLETPRLATPRTRVEAGSVGIALAQTGVYPMASPGGWRIIGRTPRKLYDPDREEPFLLRAGDTLRFVPIDDKEFSRIAREEGV